MKYTVLDTRKMVRPKKELPPSGMQIPLQWNEARPIPLRIHKRQLQHSMPLPWWARLTPLMLVGLLLFAPSASAQLDIIRRDLIQLGYDQPLNSRGPQGLYAYYYHSDPDFGSSNRTLRLAMAPVYVDGEIGFKSLLSPHTDVGIGLYGGVFGDNFYEVRQGHYYRTDSFDGHGGGASLGIYHLLNPGMLIPVNLVTKGGVRYSVFAQTSSTAPDFELPDNRAMPYGRVGIRLAGKEPILYPDLGLELSVWWERQWRMNSNPFGYNHDRSVSARSDLYWIYSGLDYAWTNSGHRISFAVTAGGSEDTDRFSAWRIGGVLPLVAEFPLILPGYFHQELTARSFVHGYASYLFPLLANRQLQFRIEAATASISYLEGFEQPDHWQTGAGCGLSYSPRSNICRIVLRYGYGFQAVRDGGSEGGHSIGLLMQYDLEQRRKRKSTSAE